MKTIIKRKRNSKSKKISNKIDVLIAGPFLLTLLTVITLTTGCADSKASLPETDSILAELINNDAIYGDITSVKVYEDVDEEKSDTGNDEDLDIGYNAEKLENNKKHNASDIYLQIDSKTDIASYVQYYKVSLKYHIFKNEWTIDSYKPDIKKKTVIVTDTLLENSDVETILSEYICSYDFGDGDRIVFNDIDDVSFSEASHSKIDDHISQYIYEVEFIANHNDTALHITGELVLYFYSPSIHNSSDSDEYIQSDQGYTVINYGAEHLNFVGSTLVIE